MLVSEEIVLKAVGELITGGKEFHTAELAKKLKESLGAPVESDVARYWANKLVLDGLLERRPISARLFVYRKREGADLSASLTIKKP